MGWYSEVTWAGDSEVTWAGILKVRQKNFVINVIKQQYDGIDEPFRLRSV